MAEIQSTLLTVHKILLPVVVALFTLTCTDSDEKNETVKRDGHVALLSEKEIIHPISRDELFYKLVHERFDILIIGGGATGAGAALDAASRGLKTALVTSGDYANGTSSRSTKLVHGGVRYLENAIKHFDWQEYQLVRDALHERRSFLNNAPHLTNPIPLITPVYGWFQAAYYLIGLKLYDFVAGDASLGHSEFLSRKKTLSRFSNLKAEGLKGAIMYYDGQFDDARMNVTLILSALRQGALAMNYARAQGLLKENGVISGAEVLDEFNNKSFSIRAKVVINATGTFADNIRKMDNPNAKEILEPSQGSHIVLSDKFAPRDHGLVIPKTKDGRVLFLLPWMGKTIAGTTDQPHENTEFPKATKEEVNYIIEHLKSYLVDAVSEDDVLATFSGLRPLHKSDSAANTAQISRDHIIEESESHLITIVGGKWTTYRKMAEEVIDHAIKTGNLSPLNESTTKNLPLVGARFYKDSLIEELVAYESLPVDIATHLANSYGDRVDAVIDVDNKSRRARLLEGYPYIEGEVIHAITNEYALHATDIIARRTRLAFLDNRASLLALPKIISLMATTLNWSAEKIESEKEIAEKFLDTMLTR